MPFPPLSRRSVTRGAAVVVAGGVVGWAAARLSALSRPAAGTAAANSYGPPSAGPTGTELARVDQVPEGGGVVLGSAGVVLTRTPEGQVHAFSATCTHQGCTVDSVAGGRISCPCHGSQFDAATGEVLRGPATRPLPPVTVEVSNGVVSTG
jgi:Rieske Fe-S protein